MTLLVALLAGIFPVYPPGGYTGKIPIAGKYTIYFPGGAFDLRGYYCTREFGYLITSKRIIHILFKIMYNTMQLMIIIHSISCSVQRPQLRKRHATVT